MAYRHAEAFMLMVYEADDHSETETVWNSRDGVTPFVITLRSGRQATHVRWAADRRMPEGWVPPSGMRVFTDLTPERARQLAEARVDQWLVDPGTRDELLAVYGTRENAIYEQGQLPGPGAPDLIDPGNP